MIQDVPARDRKVYYEDLSGPLKVVVIRVWIEMIVLALCFLLILAVLILSAL